MRIEKEVKHSKVIYGESFKYTVSESKEDKWKRQIERGYDKKVKEEMTIDIQKGLRKFVDIEVGGEEWEKDYLDIYQIVIDKILKE